MWARTGLDTFSCLGDNWLSALYIGSSQLIASASTLSGCLPVYSCLCLEWHLVKRVENVTLVRRRLTFYILHV